MLVAVVTVVALVVGVAAWSLGGGPSSGSDPSDGPAPTLASSSPPTTAAGSDQASDPSPATPTFTVTATPGVPASSQTRPLRPRAVTLPSATRVPVDVASTTTAGRLQVPDDISRAGWWDGGARVGDDYGAMVIASHVDSTTQGLGPFAELLDVTAGDQLTVRARGLEQSFTVERVRLVPKSDLDTSDALFSTAGAARLVLITCAGPYEPDNGGYQDLAVVTARPTGPPG